jgi:AGZA family xanthine/uracil permease-like MFS transporter
MTKKTSLPWFVQGDVDGFFGLFIDNLLQLMLIGVLCKVVCGLPDELVLGRILPGAGLSILAGNLFYAWQARRLALSTGRMDVTALPYGINTTSLIAYIFLVMGPVYQETKDPTLTWRVGLFACLLSGVMEVLGAWVGDWLRRHTPRAALLSALAGIAITFIAMGFIFQMFASPLLAIVPMFIILLSYASKFRWPFGLPGGFVAVLVGVLLAWMLPREWTGFAPSAAPVTLAFQPPQSSFSDALALLFDPKGWRYLAVIFPMGLFNVIGSLQNLESAEAGGDRYETKPSLLANGIGTLIAAFLGSTFPTTIYIGHPGWKAMGARWGYSILNGAVITLLCVTGGLALVLKYVPLESCLGILLWIAIIITAQAFQETPKQHALAVAVGFIPSFAAWALLLVETSLRISGTTLFASVSKFGTELYVMGAIALSQGFILTSMVLAAVVVFMIEKELHKAALWCLAASALSFFGVIHAFDLTEAGIQNKYALGASPYFAAAYLGSALLLWALAAYNKKRGRHSTVYDA